MQHNAANNFSEKHCIRDYEFLFYSSTFMYSCVHVCAVCDCGLHKYVLVCEWVKYIFSKKTLLHSSYFKFQ